MSTVTAIHIAPGRRLPMKAVNRVAAESGRGLIGDRYHGAKHRHVTVQSAEQLAEAGLELGRPINPVDTRRNLTIATGIIPTAPGTLITVGSALLEVVRVAAPCRLLDDTIGPGGSAALRRRAGSVCRILDSGTITIGDQIAWAQPGIHPTALPSDAAPGSVPSVADGPRR